MRRRALQPQSFGTEPDWGFLRHHRAARRGSREFRRPLVAVSTTRPVSTAPLPPLRRRTAPVRSTLGVPTETKERAVEATPNWVVAMLVIPLAVGMARLAIINWLSSVRSKRDARREAYRAPLEAFNEMRDESQQYHDRLAEIRSSLKRFYTTPGVSARRVASSDVMKLAKSVHLELSPHWQDMEAAKRRLRHDVWELNTIGGPRTEWVDSFLNPPNYSGERVVHRDRALFSIIALEQSVSMETYRVAQFLRLNHEWKERAYLRRVASDVRGWNSRVHVHLWKRRAARGVRWWRLKLPDRIGNSRPLIWLANRCGPTFLY